MPCEVRTVGSQINSCLSIVDSNLGTGFCRGLTGEFCRSPNVTAVPFSPTITRRIVMYYKKDMSVCSALREFLRFAGRYIGAGPADAETAP